MRCNSTCTFHDERAGDPQNGRCDKPLDHTGRHRYVTFDYSMEWDQ